MESWIVTSWGAAVMVLASAVGIYASLMLLTRVMGLRSFSKLSSFDFAITVAIGSLIASTIIAEDPPLVQAAVGLASLYALQFVVSVLRTRSASVRRAVDNAPTLLMRHGEVLPRNLAAVKMTRDDLRAKLREANVLRLSEVRAVVMESTGDVSVLHADPEEADVDPDLLQGVVGADGR